MTPPDRTGDPPFWTPPADEHPRVRYITVNPPGAAQRGEERVVHEHDAAQQEAECEVRSLSCRSSTQLKTVCLIKLCGRDTDLSASMHPPPQDAGLHPPPPSPPFLFSRINGDGKSNGRRAHGSLCSETYRIRKHWAHAAPEPCQPAAACAQCLRIL